ncbi:alpha/beta hydrolase [uncultured Campylobacter sp.]|jgi:secreted protein|uniref:alpha/beta hydrolase n=1 Tax=uncultured Campylobacter sp. TaxID=218934 RepID=UPI002602976A|nr:alpha/beta hydrolase [uncultured Campylobacter sp.]
MIKNIILVHGAFADGSCYAEVIRRLQAAGLNALAVQNPLTSLAADTQSISRKLDRLRGRALLVGHSWGGVPITHVGRHLNVAALLYLSAIVPDSRESAADALARQNAPMEGLSPDANGEIVLSAEAFAHVMANDLPAEQSRVLAAVQTPMNAAAFADKIGAAAWCYKPSYYLLTENDNALPFAVQQHFAEQIGAKTRKIHSGHLSMISNPNSVAAWIAEIVASI